MLYFQREIVWNFPILIFPHFLLSSPLTPSWFPHHYSSKTAGTRSPVTNAPLNERGTLRSTHCLTSQGDFNQDGHFPPCPPPLGFQDTPLYRCSSCLSNFFLNPFFSSSTLILHVGVSQSCVPGNLWIITPIPIF